MRPIGKNVSALLNEKSRAPLSYRHLRILGWLFIAVSQVSVVLELASFLGLPVGNYEKWSTLCYELGVIAVPLFLLANFAVILNGSKKYTSLLAMYAGFCAAFFFAYFFVVEHYLSGLMNAAASAGTFPRENLESLLRSFSPSGFIAFNVFLDLSLCTAFSYFVLGQPGLFRGKKLRYFRALAVLPVLYEAAGILLKALSSMGRIIMPVYLFPLLPTKPPMMFVLFVGLVLMIKFRECQYEQKGETTEQSEESLRKYVNTQRFSLALMGLMIVAALLDILLERVLPHAIVGTFPAGGEVEPLTAAVNTVKACGFGDATMLLFLAPFSLLISFSKRYEKTMVDMFVPLFGMALIVYVYFEGVFQILRGIMMSSW
jgi:hypothetical protein